MKLYQVSVYWAHGISVWQGKLIEREVVFRTVMPWLWLARRVARANLGNCGALAYSIHDSKCLIEEFQP